ncbi:MAG: NUDIX hydrolase [Endomicrobium sp.]|uniref:NUDIX domain-containing protein n=1 Tax=Candidatus Endomicrobiellum pyrsonymphae TaxID=1408203 RepID=UPI0035883396|nr:NUDIX hydrolase [Endomicrobium sp.]
MKTKDMIEKLIKKNRIFKGKILDLFCDDVELPNGELATREYLQNSGATTVLPFLDRENIVLVKQFRYPLNQITYELPAGKMDKDETPLACVIRELQEETGYKAKRLEELLSFYPTTAFSTEIIHLFAAFGLKEGVPNPDKDEFVSKEILSFKDAVKMVRTGEIKDSKTIIALLYFENILK